MSAHLRGAHAYSVLVSAFCGDELRVNVVARGELSFEKSLRLAKASGIARSPRPPLPRNLLPYHIA